MSTANDHEIVDSEPGSGYALSGKIMLSAIIILFAVVVFMVGLHLYARWYLIRLRRRQLERRRHRRSTRTHVVLYADNHRGAAVDRGLEPAVLSSLPVFIFSDESGEQPVKECAVCLSEFEDKEIVRLLPKCNHSFHIECIDMWFHSHSTCPLCRSTVEPVTKPVESNTVELSVVEPSSSSGSEMCDACQKCEASSTVRKVEVRIDVPPRRALFETELTQGSPTSRMLSLKRILSFGIRSPMGSRSVTPCAAGTSGGATELDLESGLGESTRVQTPR